MRHMLRALPHTGSRIGADAQAASNRRLVGPAYLRPPPLPPWLVVWRDAADRLPRRVLISGRDNDPIVIGSWPPAQEIAGVRSWLRASRSALVN